MTVTMTVTMTGTAVPPSLSLLLTLVSLESVSAKLPNIVLVLADDLGWGDVGWNNAKMLDVTPRLTELARSGLILSQYYVQQVCTPSRAALMTGLYPFHTGRQKGTIKPLQPTGLTLQRSILPEKLRRRGYKTHAVGKWHLGFCKWEYTPTYRGFDSFHGYYCGAEHYFSHKRDNYYDFRSNTTVDWSASDKYSTDLFTSEAERIVRTHDSRTPLFLYVPYQATHAPLQAPADEYARVRKTSNHERDVYRAMLARMDAGVGRIVAALKETGQWDNTVLVFTTDNGGAVSMAGSNYPLRGTKGTLFEGGTRGAAFLAGGAVGGRGRKTDQLMHITDWFPTLLSMAGQRSQSGLDGVDQSHIVRNGRGVSKRTELVYNLKIKTVQGAIRVGDYKLMFAKAFPKDGWYNPDGATTRRSRQKSKKSFRDLRRARVPGVLGRRKRMVDGAGETNATMGEEINDGTRETNDDIGEANDDTGETNDDTGEVNEGSGDSVTDDTSNNIININDGTEETNDCTGNTNDGTGETNNTTGVVLVRQDMVRRDDGQNNILSVNFNEVEEGDMIAERVKKEAGSQAGGDVKDNEENNKENYKKDNKQISKSSMTVSNKEEKLSIVENITQDSLKDDTGEVDIVEESINKDVVTKVKIKIKRKRERVKAIKRNHNQEKHNKINKPNEKDKNNNKNNSKSNRKRGRKDPKGGNMKNTKNNKLNDDADEEDVLEEPDSDDVVTEGEIEIKRNRGKDKSVSSNSKNRKKRKGNRNKNNKKNSQTNSQSKKKNRSKKAKARNMENTKKESSNKDDTKKENVKNKKFKKGKKKKNRAGQYKKSGRAIQNNIISSRNILQTRGGVSVGNLRKIGRRYNIRPSASAFYGVDKDWSDKQTNTTEPSPTQLFLRHWPTLKKHLFNVRTDPEERFDLTITQPQIVEQLRKRVLELLKTFVPRDYPKPSKKGKPSNFGNVWSPGWC